MKVGQLYETNQVDAATRVGNRTGRDLPVGKNAGGRGPDTVDTDRVKLSDAALHAAGADDSFDAARVTALQKAIAEGRYPVDAAKIADAMISQAADLLRTLADPAALSGRQAPAASGASEEKPE